MLKSHEKYFASTDGKRQILVVDDEQINREILGFMLQDEYDVLYAADGEEALDMIRSHVHTLSLVLLDLMMPKLDGFHLMDILRSDDELKQIPYIVLTSEKSAEVNSLKNGASDFIAKPFDQPEVIQARIQRTIELAEDKDIIQSTERDPLTSLFNREFFYRYVEQYDLHHPDADMDALSLDINHFHMINELYGWDFGDEVLSNIGNKVRELMAERGGIAGRIDADMFLVYFPSGADYEKLQEELCKDLLAGKKSNKVKLRLGVYPNVDRTVKRHDPGQLHPLRRVLRCVPAAEGTAQRTADRKPRYGDRGASVQNLLPAEIRYHRRRTAPAQRGSAHPLAAS